LEGDGLCFVTEVYYEPVVIDGKEHYHDGNKQRMQMTCTNCQASFVHESIAACSIQECEWNKKAKVKGVLKEV
jgi:hypothetical protein